MTLDSVPGSTAVNIVKHMNKPEALSFALDLSRNIFAHGMDPGDPDQIASIMVPYGFSKQEAFEYLQSDQGKYMAYQDFQWRSEEHTSELQSRGHLVCRLLLE